MAQAVNNDGVKKIFKTVYGGQHDLVAMADVIDELLPYSASEATGKEFVEDFIMGDEVGATWAGQDIRAFKIKEAIAGAIEQSSVKGTQFVLSSVIPWGFMTRSAGGGEKAFFDGTKLVMKNHLSSHSKLRAIEKIYGQSDTGLGYVSFAPSGTIYRGVAYSGSGTITLKRKSGLSMTFTNGVCATASLPADAPTGSKSAILFAPGTFAAGFWVGKKGIVVKEVVSSSGAVAKSGSLVGMDARIGCIFVDFDATVASGLTSHKIVYDEWEGANPQCMVGVKKIIQNTGSLFGINASDFDLWSGQVIDMQQKKFNLKALTEGVADAINSGGLEEPLDVVVNTLTFGQMANDEAALRKYDASYKSASATNGFEAIEWYAANGTNRIRASSKVMEGDVFGLVKEHWKCSGSQAPSFRPNGLGQEVIFPLNDQAGWVVRSFSDMFVICRMPARQILWTNCNPEGAAY
jgi:hypothetical protein